MADPKKQREYLRAYTKAARALELHEVAINVLEAASTTEAAQAIKTLKRGQQRQVGLLDTAAAKLGAPYPAGVALGDGETKPPAATDGPGGGYA